MPGAVLSLAFFLSGAAGLIFQVVWFHRAGLVFGSSVTSVTVVLSAFMAGLAFGNGLAARSSLARFRSIESYAALEVIVAVSGAAVTFALPFASAFLTGAAHLVDSASVLNVVRLAGAFALLAVPSTAMGATLPVIVGALTERGSTYGAALGRLYGWNTAGAVVGVLAADVVLVAALGVRDTSLVAGALNVIAAALAWSVRRSATPHRVSTANIPAERRSMASRHTATRLPWLAGATGAILLALEVVWFRFLTLFVLSTTLAASLMVAAVLAGIAFGGFAAGAWLRTEKRAIRLTPWLSVAGMVTTAGAFAAFQWTTSGTQVEAWTRVLWFAIALAVPTAAISGAIFTTLGDAFNDQLADPVAATAQLALCNTVGALLGPGLAAFVLLPSLGTERTLLVLAVAYGVVAILALEAARSAGEMSRRSLISVGALMVATVVLFPHGVTARAYFSRAASTYAGDGSTVLRTSEGPSETIFLMEQRWHGEPIYHRLVTNGFSMTGTGIPGQRYMRAFAYVPMLLHSGPLERALLICYGVGVTASAALEIPSLKTLDIAEISHDVVAMSDAIYNAKNPIDDPRTKLHVEDGRFFLSTSPDTYDLITGEPPPPRTPGTVNIYTEEYFRLLRSRLNPGGIVSYWLPVARPNPGTDIDTVIRAFCNVFDDCTLWNSTPFDFMLIGTRDAPGHIDADVFAAPWVTPGLQASLREVGFERPEQIGATFLGDRAYLDELTRETPPLTDDYPQRLRPTMRPSLSDPNYGTSPDVRAYYDRAINTNRARAAFEASPFIAKFWPADLKEKTLPYFDYQRMINDALWDGGKPIAHIEDLHAVLTHTTLRTLPLWMLGSDDVKARIASAHQVNDFDTLYTKAARALSGRDYESAAGLFRVARGSTSQPATTPTIELLWAYAEHLRRSGEDMGLINAARPRTEEERHFWEWLKAKGSEPR